MTDIAPTPELRAYLLRTLTAAAHSGDSKDDLMEKVMSAIEPLAAEAAAKDSREPARGFLVAKTIARTAKTVQSAFDSYIDRDDIAQGRSGIFDARSLGCWLEIAAAAGVPAVPARKVLEIPEPYLDLLIDPAEAKAVKPGLYSKMLNAISGGAMHQNFGLLAAIEPAKKREMLALGQALVRAAGQEIPSGHMVRHDIMGPNTLKAWAGIGWEPWSGDDGVKIDAGDGRVITLGPGWIGIGNDRIIDVIDSRTVKAIATTFRLMHTFWARPWMKPARRYTGLDIHRQGLPENMRQGSWPAEWRVFVRGSKAVAVSAYYPWADIPGDELDRHIAEQAMEMAERMAAAAQSRAVFPGCPQLDMVRQSFEEAAEKFPQNTVNASLDFIETDQGLMFLEGAMAAGPGGGAHPCAFVDMRWPEGMRFGLNPGVKLEDPKTWGNDIRRPLARKRAA